jgi:hypothetical protein
MATHTASLSAVRSKAKEARSGAALTTPTGTRIIGATIMFIRPDNPASEG